MAFADDFEKHVIPMLRRACRLHGLLVVVGSETWMQAHGAIMSIALNRGASRLPADVFEQLQERVSAGLLAGCAHVEDAWQEKRYVAARIAADLARHYVG